MQTETLEATIKQDRHMGLVTVVCPKCGVTAGVLPNSDTFHATCGGIRMRPADPVLAKQMRQRATQQRLLRERDRARKAKVPRQLSPLQREKVRIQTRERVRRHRDTARASVTV